MMAHVTGQSRYQSTLFPEVLDEVVGRDDPVRVIDAFVDGLDLEALGFSKVATEEMGRPPYAPGDLLKLYIYGYLHRVRASRRLEAETRRNVQVMWLLNRLTPAFKTIADFRKDHAGPIVGVCRAFIRFCREQSHQRAIADPIWMKQRREAAEHPFGTMKWLMAQPRFLIKGLRKAKAELALGVLNYNLKRVINILGVPALLQALAPAPA